MDTTSSLRVLVVDDCRDAADSLAQLITLWGHAPLVAYGSQTALELASIYQPHVALLDLAIPHMDGIELARRLRARPELAGMALFALTGVTNEATWRRARESGIEQVLCKPVEPRTLETLLEQIASQALVKTTPPIKRTKKLPVVKDHNVSQRPH